MTGDDKRSLDEEGREMKKERISAEFEAGRAELDAEISRLRAALRWVHDNVSPENVAAIRLVTILALVSAVDRRAMNKPKGAFSGAIAAARS